MRGILDIKYDPAYVPPTLRRFHPSPIPKAAASISPQNSTEQPIFIIYVAPKYPLGILDFEQRNMRGTAWAVSKS